MNRRVTAALLAGGAALAIACSSGDDEDAQVSADPSKLDDAGRFACQDFADGYAAAQTAQARVDLTNKVTKWSARSATLGIREGGEALGRTAESPDQAWKLAADTFAQACIDAGYPTKR